MSGYNAATGVWASSAPGAKSTKLTGIMVDNDAPGDAGNSVPITYISGSPTTKIVFPEVYTGLTTMSICTVSRYTSTLAQYRQRLWQPYNAQINWLHGHYRCVSFSPAAQRASGPAPQRQLEAEMRPCAVCAAATPASPTTLVRCACSAGHERPHCLLHRCHTDFCLLAGWTCAALTAALCAPCSAGWLASPWYQLATTATVWVSTCASYDLYTGGNTLDVNGHPSSLAGDMAGLTVPDQISVNANLASIDAQWSAFGVAEMLVWNRVITGQEMREAQQYLTTKYGLAMSTPPAPPVPAAPMPPAPAFATDLAPGMMAWCVAARGAASVTRKMRCNSMLGHHDKRCAHMLYLCAFFPCAGCRVQV